MARETKIGIALMVLLVGVFGFMVYRKWNGRAPAAVAAAATSTETSDKTGNDPAGEETAPDPVADAPLAPNAFAADPVSPADFGSQVTATAAPVQPAEPPRQAESFDPFTGSGDVSTTTPPADSGRAFVAEAESDSPFESNQAAAPLGQAEPVSVFSETPFSPSSQSQPPAETDIAADTVPAGNTAGNAPMNPFAGAAGQQPARPFAATAAEAAPFENDPFGDARPANSEPASEIAATTGEELAPIPEDDTFGAATAAMAEGDPFGGATADSMPAETETAPVGNPFAATATATVASGAAPASDSAAATAIVEDDPFGEVEQTTGSEAVDSAQPERLFQPGATVPVAGPFAEDDSPAEENLEPAGIDESPFGDTMPSETRQADAEAAPSEPFTIQATPEPPDSPGIVAGSTDYRVVSENDSFWLISKKVYGTPIYFHALSKFNADRIADPNRLKPGMKILTPPAEELARRFPHLVSQSAGQEKETDSQRAGFVLDAEGRPTYRVGKADTLTGIAQAHLGRASRWVQIYEMNRKVIPDPKSLKPGTALRLPADASRVRLVPEG